MKIQYLSGILLISAAAFAPFRLDALSNLSAAFNADNVILPSSEYTPDTPYSALVYIVNTGQQFGDGEKANSNYNKIWGVPQNDSKGNAWYDVDYQPVGDSTSQWTTQQAPFSSDDTYLGHKSYQWVTSGIMGEIYMRRTFNLSEVPANPVFLACGHDDAPSEWYINGTLVHTASDGWDNDEYVLLTDEQKNLLKAGENLIAVHVHQNWGGAFADCGLYRADMEATLMNDFNSGVWDCVYKLVDTNDAIDTAVSQGAFAVDTNESDWTPAKGPFSNSSDKWNNTYWDSSAKAILIRRHFTVDANDLEILKESKFHVTCSYDEYPVIYLNNTRICSFDMWNDDRYDTYILSEQDKSLLRSGDNVFAISLRKGDGGGHVDYGLFAEVDYSKITSDVYKKSLSELYNLFIPLRDNDYSRIYNEQNGIRVGYLDYCISYCNRLIEDSSYTTAQLSEGLSMLNNAYFILNSSEVKSLVGYFFDTYLLVQNEADAEWADTQGVPLRSAIDMTPFLEAYNAATNAEEFANALEMLRYARRLRAAVNYEDLYKHNAVAEGKFYLYNVGRKQFLSGGSDWGAHAALGNPGVEIQLEDAGNGNYYVNSGLNNGENRQYLTASGYLDGDKFPYSFRLVEGSDNVYNIVRTENGTTCLMAWYPDARVDAGNGDETTVGTEIPVEGGVISLSDPEAQWILVTKADRMALIPKATETDPADVTFLLNCTGFNRHENFDNLWWISEFGVWEPGQNQSDYVFESYDTPVGAYFSYQAEDIPSGVYKVCIQGFYRNGDHAEQADKDKVQNALFFAGNNESYLPNITEYSYFNPGEGTTAGSSAAAIADADGSATYEYPENIPQATKAFRSGLYNTYVAVTVEDGYSLPIGVEKLDRSDRDWITVDNIRLYYYGTETDEETVYALPDPNSLTAKNLSGIEEVLDEILEAIDAPHNDFIYNLQGIRVVNPTAPGIYIRNGKKYLIR